MNSDISEKELKRLKEIERKQKERYKKQNKQTNELYDRLSFTVPKGNKSKIEAAAKSEGLTVNKFISEVLLKVIVNKDMLKMIFNNNIENVQEEQMQEPIENIQKTEIVSENLDAEESVSQEKPKSKENEKPMTMEELQAYLEEKRRKETERKQQAEDIKAQADKERQERFQAIVNGVFDDMKNRKEQRREEDRKKYKDISDDMISNLLQDAEFSGWLETTGFENALDPLSDEIGINNAEKVINVAKERKRKESIENAGCHF